MVRRSSGHCWQQIRGHGVVTPKTETAPHKDDRMRPRPLTRKEPELAANHARAASFHAGFVVYDCSYASKVFTNGFRGQTCCSISGVYSS